MDAVRGASPLSPTERDTAPRERVEGRGALVPGLSLALVGAPALLRLSGVDHREALDRIVSQDVKRLPAGEGRLALLLAPKGQFRALMAVFGGTDELLLAAPPGRGEALANSLTAYLRFSKSRLEPITRAPRALLLTGGGWGEVASACGADAVVLARGGWCRQGEGDGAVDWLGQTFLGFPGAIVVAADGEVLDGIERQVRARGATPQGEAALELERIRVGFPAWGAELSDTVLPPEVGIDGAAISYTKGCYIGQETIARMRTYGHPNRTLVGVRLLDGSSGPKPPLELRAEGDDRFRGVLTSFAVHPERGGVGLALVRRELAAPGTHLTGGASTLEVAPLPLW